MTAKSWFALIALFSMAALPFPSYAEDAPSQDNILSQIGLTQNVGNAIDLSLPFTDEKGEAVTLEKYFKDKPVLLMPVYYECPMLCGLILKGTLSALRVLKFTAGKEFNIVTFTIDPRETPDLAAAKKESVLKEYGREGAESGWHFLTANTHPDSITKLTQALGYRYVYDETAEEYAHPSAIMIMTPDGRVARYFTGIEFSPRDMRLTFVEAAEKKIGSVIDAVMLLCYHYNPQTGKYGLMIDRVTKIAGVLTIIFLFGFIGTSLFKEKKK